MENYFDRELLQMEKELTRLKTSMVKSGTAIVSTRKTINYSIPLVLNPAQTSARGEKIFNLLVDDDAIIIPTLDWYFGNPNDVYTSPNATRVLTFRLQRIDKGFYIVTIYATGDSSDVVSLIGGSAVTISGKLTVQCSSNFTLEAVT